MGQGRTMSMNKEIDGSSNWGTAIPGAGRSFYVVLTIVLGVIKIDC